MRVDYHFHPNLQGKNPLRRVRAVWSALERCKLDAVICTEHSFKNAPRAYRMLIEGKPAHARTHVYPGAELVTSDGGHSGIDVIAFAEDDWYDRHPRLLEPFSMTLKEMVGYLEQSELSYFIPHPYLIKSPLMSVFQDDAEMRQFLASVPAFESFNGCYLGLEQACSLPVLRVPLEKFSQKLRTSSDIRSRPLQTRQQFLAIGSDAHHPSDIGFSVEVACKRPRSRHEAFESLTHNTDISTLHGTVPSCTSAQLLRTGWTTLSEAWMRRGWRVMLYLRDLLTEQEVQFSDPVTESLTDEVIDEEDA